MSAREITLRVGESVELYADGHMEDGSCVSALATEWTVSDSSALQLNRSRGPRVLVTARAAGVAKVRAEHPARRAEMHQEQVDELFGGAVSRGTRTIVQDVSSPVPDEVWIRVVAADDVLNFRLLAIGIGERRESK